MKRRFGIVALALALPLVPVAVEASPVTLGFHTSSTSLGTFFGDQFSESGLSGLLNLDTSVSKVVTVSTANFNIVDYTYDNGGFESKPITLSFDMTLDGVTHSLTQTGTWSITPTWDSMLSFNSVAPVLFNTPDGSWNVSLLGFSVGGGVLGSFSAPIQAQATPTPEPGTLMLLCAGLAGGGIRRWRKRQQTAA
jgi:PEP-CTERM motif-containing protein